MAAKEGALEKSHGKDSMELIEELLQKFGLELERGEGLKPASMNNAGFILANFSAAQSLIELAKITANSTQDS